MPSISFCGSGERSRGCARLFLCVCMRVYVIVCVHVCVHACVCAFVAVVLALLLD